MFRITNMRKEILFCAVIGLASLGIIIGKSAAVEKATAGPVRVWNNTKYEVYVRVGYVNHSSRNADRLNLKPDETWTGGKSGPINAVTGYIYTPSGRKNLSGFERENYGWSPQLQNSHSFEIKEIQGYWGSYGVEAQ
jgi:hypothetical protein